MIPAPQRFLRRHQTTEVPRRPLVPGRPDDRQQPLRRHPALRRHRPCGGQFGHRVVIPWPLLPHPDGGLAGLGALDDPPHGLVGRAADIRGPTISAHLLVGGDDLHSYPRRLQWRSLGGDVNGWHHHGHRPGPKLRIDTTSKGWGLSPGHHRGPLPGHQWGLFHGHSHGAGVVLVGPGGPAVRGERRINAVLTAVRRFIVHAVTSGSAPDQLLPLIYELADDRDLPTEARGEDARLAWRMRARHRLHEPEAAVDRASDEEIVAVLTGCRSARDRLIVLLMARAGLRRGEACGLRRADVHLLLDSQRLGCELPRAHLHVVRRDNPNGAWATSAGNGWRRWTSWWCRPSTTTSSSAAGCRAPVPGTL